MDSALPLHHVKQSSQTKTTLEEGMAATAKVFQERSSPYTSMKPTPLVGKAIDSTERIFKSNLN